MASNLSAPLLQDGRGANDQRRAAVCTYYLCCTRPHAPPALPVACRSLCMLTQVLAAGEKLAPSRQPSHHTILKCSVIIDGIHDQQQQFDQVSIDNGLNCTSH